MTPYCELGREELLELKKELTQKYEDPAHPRPQCSQ